MLLYLLERPAGNIAGVGRKAQPMVGLPGNRAPRIKCRAHLFRVKGERVLADVYVVGNCNHFEVVAQNLRAVCQ